MKHKARAFANHLLKSHETIMDFAFRKRVHTRSIYDAIKAGKIVPDVVGTSRVQFIDLKKYGSYRFRVHNSDKSTLIKWFLSVDYQIKGKKAHRKAQAILSSKKTDKGEYSNLQIKLSSGQSIVCFTSINSAPEQGYIVERLILPLLRLQDSTKELLLIKRYCAIDERNPNATYRYNINLTRKTIRLYLEMYNRKKGVFYPGKDITERYGNYVMQLIPNKGSRTVKNITNKK